MKFVPRLRHATVRKEWKVFIGLFIMRDVIVAVFKQILNCVFILSQVTSLTAVQ
jgi:hypothetical protein